MVLQSTIGDDGFSMVFGKICIFFQYVPFFVKMCSFCQNVIFLSNCSKIWSFLFLISLNLVLPIFVLPIFALPIFDLPKFVSSYICSSYIYSSYICASYIWSFLGPVVPVKWVGTLLFVFVFILRLTFICINS